MRAIATGWWGRRAGGGGRAAIAEASHRPSSKRLVLLTIEHHSRQCHSSDSFQRAQRCNFQLRLRKPYKRSFVVTHCARRAFEQPGLSSPSQTSVCHPPPCARHAVPPSVLAAGKCFSTRRPP
jgi:hypothetical protein